MTSTATLPIKPSRLVNVIDWSNLPHDILQARASLERLRALGLVERKEGGYVPTGEGANLIRSANKKGLWRD